MKVMILRIGIDTGTDGALGPIFKDGTFEYIPISESCPTKETRRFCDIPCRNFKNLTLANFLPDKISKRIVHFDPEFETFTYGDYGKGLSKLNRKDILVFYAGLIQQVTPYRKGLYIIGFFTVKGINTVPPYSYKALKSLYPNNAHLLRREGHSKKLIIVSGYSTKSRLLRRALLISEYRKSKIGTPYHVVSKPMVKILGISGSIQRSSPRFVTELENVENIRRLLLLNK